MTRTRLLLLMGAALPLAACGADDVASPGEGVIVVPAPTPTTPTPTTPTPTTPTPTPGTPAADCPTGTTDAGVIGSVRACRLPTQILSDLTLARRAGTAYMIDGRVDVGIDVGGASTPASTGRSAILTVQPGVVLFGNGGPNGGADNDFLVVNRGSQILAEGTASLPIIFTSRQNIDGTVAADSQGQWGGVILAGRAPISNCDTTVAGGSAGCQAVVEGTGNARYGGEVANDSSGIFRYVQIRYSGIAISAGNELQGLTMAGVGSGTRVDHIHVHNSADDGIEVFGGRVNANYLVMTGTDDDALDTDVGHQGAFQFVLAIQRTGNGSSDPRGLEIDSDSNPDALPRNDFRLANFTLVSALNFQSILLRGGTDATLVNGVVVNPLSQCLDIDGSETIRAADTALQDRGPPAFQSLFFQCASPFTDDTNVTGAQIQTVFGASTNTNNTTNGTGGLSGTFITAGAAASVTPFNAASLNFAGQSFLVQTNYIGAVRDANDTWYRGWTCDSATASFGSNLSCTALPTL
ncbi:hypothetical protein GGR88_000748 [Sphingomonas jejuensis]|uniref:Lipoprotein n=1 Tax=Sphingomonas jejuensis TaxID=904715 RepID=A0ABX0XJ67_9SPHN|nr:hypothetical protein [Sphingomonas jejuensis]NJC33274.1 hypothetical protein [Sphingomonas jejuensis]